VNGQPVIVLFFSEISGTAFPGGILPVNCHFPVVTGAELKTAWYLPPGF
jgi:hypothetical protein